MNTLWTFGDSFTSYFHTNDIPWTKQYIKWKGDENPKVFGDFVSEELGMELKNFGIGGCDNYTILSTICEQINNIKEGDIVSVGWSHTQRFRLVDIRSQFWLSMNPHMINDEGLGFISNNTLLEILDNRNHYLYKEELDGWINMIDKCLSKNQIIHWTWVDNKEFQQYNKVVDETNGEVDDQHWSEIGHKQFSEWFIRKLNSNSKSYI
jgi:hypothetical protein